MTKKLTVVLSQGRGKPSSRQALQQELACALADWPSIDVLTLPHLYDLAPDGPGMQHLRSLSGDLIVLSWLYPRAAFWLLDANGVKGRMGRTSFFPEEELATPLQGRGARDEGRGADRTIWCLDLREHDQLEPLLEEIERLAAESTGEPVVAVVQQGAPDSERRRFEESSRRRWYPVIDYSRCGNCLECLNFCLFGVFGRDAAEQIFVEQPDACRDGCPACSRVCPSRAIMFPQHNNPAIAGDPEAPDDAFHFDVVQLLGMTSAAELAAAERDHALSEKAQAEKSAAQKPARNHDLDQLVNDLDGMDL